ncbi:hypothetical protein [Blastococcus sp. CT_GayMR16]|uniref:hypothetical protein n=1 Tax=Blastococcus sp. CT_GayMR16 TaxID=2559607 RepID=UPI0010733F5C|nr:hypothetical protein [Blastococcus sp. CT_GayMR16]TFV87813.1 hypothetical protein E4P38_12630 [Blastococcus sp. CT_GayMR16]
MSIRHTLARRSRTATITIAAAAVLVGAGSGAALAEPQPGDRDDCVLALARAGSWPGSMSDGNDTVRLVSDAFTSYLSRTGGCAADPTIP